MFLRSGEFLCEYAPLGIHQMTVTPHVILTLAEAAGGSQWQKGVDGHPVLFQAILQT